MNQQAIIPGAEQEKLLTQLAQSRTHILTYAQEGRLDPTRVYLLANSEIDLCLLLHPMPLAPDQHTLAAHAYAHRYLERLTLHDPARLVVADDAHSYTPRKILRRILDHALDHLNQLEQWLLWQQQDIMPTPTDGWATSGDTFPEDLQPLSPSELQAWLWRIDLTVGLVAQRARHLTQEQLDWIAPDSSGWSLRRMLHHLALAEVYYAVWMDEPLPDEALARYSEASSRFEQRLRKSFTQPLEEGTAFFKAGGDETTTPEEIAQLVLAEERTLLQG